MRRGLWPALCAAGVIAGGVAEWTGFGWDQPGAWIPDLITGWVLIGCGLAGWWARPGSRFGLLMVGTGFAWFAGTIATAALYLHRGPLVHLVLGYPDEARPARRTRIAIAVGYAVAVVPALWRSAVITIVLAAVMVVVSLSAHAGAVGRERRASAYGLAATTFLAMVLIGTAAVRLGAPTQAATDATLLVYEAALCVLSGALLLGLVRAPWERAPVTDLVVDLGERRAGSLRDALAGALGDPTLEVGYLLGNGYVTADGRPLALPAPGSRRLVTPVERDGEPIAVLVHDPAVLDDPGVANALATAARLAASNARLQAEVRAQLAELHASRRRLLDVADEERRRLEQRLHETVERRLTRLELTLAQADSGRLRAAEEQLAHTRDALRELAAGLHPGGLIEGTLSRALTSLAGRSPVPVDLSVPHSRLPAEIEIAAYFVCAEALANVVKYADASRVAISVGSTNDEVLVLVEDDGAGGADVAKGTGLLGLADRVEALGGTLRVDSPPGGGTRLAAELPLREPRSVVPRGATSRWRTRTRPPGPSAGPA